MFFSYDQVRYVFHFIVISIPLLLSTIANSTQWTGAVNNVWTNAGNWSGGVPNNAVVATINTLTNAPIITSVANASFLGIASSYGTSGSLVVSTGGNLTVAGGGSLGTGAIDAGNNGTLTILNGGTVTFSSPLNITSFGGNIGTLNIGTGAGTSPGVLVGNLVLGAGATLNFNHNSSSYIFSNIISMNMASGAPVNINNGTTIFTRDTPNLGTTTINNGTLYLGNNTATGNVGGNVVIAVNGTLGINRNNTYLLTGNISGSGNFVQQGSGRTELQGTNTGFTGPISVLGGTLYAYGLDRLGANNSGYITTTMTLNGGTFEGGGLSTFGLSSLAMVGTGRLHAGAVGGIRVGAITGAGTLTISGPQPVQLDMSGAYTGAVTINNDSTAIFNGNTATMGAVTNNGTLTFTYDSLHDHTSIISGTGTVNHNIHTVVFRAANTYTGPTNIGISTLRIGAGGSINNTSVLNISGGSPGGTFDISATTTTPQKVGDLTGGVGATINLGSKNLIFGTNNPTSQTYNGIFADGGIGGGTAGSITKQGTGTAILTGANTFTGDLILQQGSVSVTQDSNLGATGVSFDGGALDLLSNNTFTRAMGITANDGTINIHTFSPTISTAITSVAGGAMTVIGTGTLTLTGNNNFNAGITVTGGASLNASTNARLGGALTLNNGTFLPADVTYSRNVSMAGPGTIDTNGVNPTFSGVFSGSGTLTKLGAGNAQFSGATNLGFSGAININDGGIVCRETNALGTGTITGGYDNWVLFFNTAPIIDFTNNLVVNNPGTISSQVIANQKSPGILSGNQPLTIQGGGRVSLRTPSTFTNTLDLISPTTLALEDLGSLEYATISMFVGTATFDISNITPASTKVKDIDIHNLTSTIKLGPKILEIGFGDATSQVYGAIVDTGGINPATGGGINKVGSGALQLYSSNNSFGGELKITGGTVTFSNNGALGITPYTIRFAGISTTYLFPILTDNLTIANPLIFDGTAHIMSNGYNLNLNGTTSGAAGLILGGNNIYLNGAQGHTGSTLLKTNLILSVAGTNSLLSSLSAHTIEPGATLTLNGATQTVGSIDGSGTINLNSGAILNNGGDNTSTTFSGLIAGDGVLGKFGSEILTLPVANTYSGGTNLNEGILAISNNSSLGTGALTISGPATLRTNTALTFANNIVVNNAFTFDTNGFDSTITGEMSSASAFSKNGIGTLTLNNTNVMTGALSISNGTLVIANSGSLGAHSSISIGSSSSVLDVSQVTAPSFKLVATTSGSVIRIGPQTLTLGAAAGSATIAGNITDSGGINASTGGSLIKSLANTQTLSGVNTYSGTTSITGGTLLIEATSAIPPTTALSLANTAGVIFNVSGAGGTVTVGSISGGGTSGGQIVLGANALNIGGNNSTTIFNGIISGTGSVNKQGTGVMTLGGANTYSGGTTVSAGTLVVGDGDTAGSITGNITNNAALIFKRSDTITYSNIISGSGTLEKQGSGTLRLIGNNTYSGETTVSAGTLVVGDGGTAGSISGNITNNTALIFNRSDTITYSNIISGSGTLEKQGSGTLRVTGTNTYSGGTTVSAGTLVVGDGGTAGGISGNITNNAALIFNRSDGLTYSNIISGSGTLEKQGSGTLRVTGTNTYSGGTIVSSGTLNILNASNIGGTGSPVSMNGGTLQLEASGVATTFSNMTITNNGGTITNSSGNLLTLVNLGGSGDLNLAGGSVLLSGAKTNSGNVNVNSGVLQVDDYRSVGVGSALSLGDGTTLQLNSVMTSANPLANGIGITGAVTINPQSTTSYLSGIISGSGGLTIGSGGSTGVVVLGAANTYVGATTIASGSLALETGSSLATSSISIVSSAVLDISKQSVSLSSINAAAGSSLKIGSQNLGVASGTFAGSIQDGGIGGGTGGSVTKSTSGTFTMTGTSTYTGATDVSGGVFAIGAGGSLSIDTELTVSSGASFDITASTTAQQVGSISGAGSIALGTKTLTVAGTGNTTFSGGFTGTTGRVIKGGTGKTTLSGTSSHAGGFTLNDGSLAVSSYQALGSGILTFGVANKTLEIAGGITAANPLPNNLVLAAAGIVDVNGFNAVLSGTITGSGNLTIGNTAGTAGTLRFSNAGISYAGITTIPANTTVELTGSSTNFSTGGIINSGLVRLVQSSNSTLASIISGSGGLTQAGSAILTVNGAQMYTGATHITSGTLALGATGSINNTSGITLASGASFDVSNKTTPNLANVTAPANSNIWIGAQTVSLSSETINGNILDGGVSGGVGGIIVKTAVGTVTLGGNNTYSGGTDLNAGMIVINSNISLGSGALRVGGSGGTVQTGSGVTLANSITLSNPLVFDSNGFNSTLSGNMSGTSSFMKQGSGTLRVTGTNTYSGGTTVSAGTLVVGDGGTAGIITGNITNNAALIFNRSDDLTYSNIISGSGTLEKQGSGALRVTGTNTHSGGTIVSAGALLFTSVSNIGGSSSLITLNGGRLQLDAGAMVDVSLSNVILGAAGGGVSNASTAYNLTVSNAMSGTGSLAKSGVGKAVLSGLNSYSGGTTVSAGVLQGTSSSLQGAIINNATVIFDQIGIGTYAGAMSGAGVLIKQNNGELVLNGINSHTGGIQINAGTISFNSTLNLGAGGTSAPLILNGGALKFRADANASVILNGISLGSSGGILNNESNTYDFEISNALTGTGGITVASTGKVTLTGANTYSGGTIVSAGTLEGNGTSLQGAITNNATVVFNQVGTSTYSNAMMGAGQLVKEGAGTLILVGSNNYTGGTIINNGVLQGNTTSLKGAINNGSTVVFYQTVAGSYAGIISGPGFVRVTGNADLNLTTANTYSGGTELNASRLIVSNDQALGTGDLRFSNAGTLGLENGITLANNLILTADAHLESIGGDGSITGDISGTSSLHITGTGTITLAGNNSYGGGTELDAGTLSVSSDANLGGMVSGLVFNGGTLKITTGFTTARSMTFNSTAIINPSGTTNSNFTGNLSGGGGLTLVDTAVTAGGVTFSGNNSYNGRTLISRGTIIGGAANVFSPNSGIELASSSAKIDLANYDQSIPSLAGIAGSTVDLGTATLTTGSANLQTIFAGSLVGTGRLNKVGSGRFELSGNSSATMMGEINVQQGEIKLSGSVGGDVIVQSSGIITGTGFIGGNLIGNGGILAPGNSPGAITVNNYTPSVADTLRIALTPTNSSQLIINTGVVNLAGSVLLDVSTVSGIYSARSYTILTAAGGIAPSTQFTLQNPTVGTLNFALSYTANSVILNLLDGGTANINLPSGNDNSGVIGDYINNIVNNPSNPGALNDLITVLIPLTPDEQSAALNQLHPASNVMIVRGIIANEFSQADEVFEKVYFDRGYKAFVQSNKEVPQSMLVSLVKEVSAGGFLKSILRNTANKHPRTISLLNKTEEKNNLIEKSTLGNTTFWLRESGYLFNENPVSDGGKGVPGITSRTLNTNAGVDHAFTSELTLGLMGGYANRHYDLGWGYGKGDIETYRVGLYTMVTFGDSWYVNAAGYYAYHKLSGERFIKIPDFNKVTKQKHHANQINGILEIGRDFIIRDNYRITPYVGISVLQLIESSYNETGADSVSLKLHSNKTTAMNAKAGLQVTSCHKIKDISLLPYLKLGYIYRRQNSGKHIKSGFINQETDFIVSVNNKPKNLFNGGMGIGATWDAKYALQLVYNGGFSFTEKSHELLVKFDYKF